MKFSGLAEDIFSRIRARVDSSIGSAIPEAARKLVAVHESLLSENAENWANAVHSCRRILQTLSDFLCPPRPDQKKIVNRKEVTIKLGPENYINRIIQYIEDNSSSDVFNSVVGSNLAFMGDRLDSIFSATQKGSHKEICTREEAERYVIYSYLLLGDILTLEKKEI